MLCRATITLGIGHISSVSLVLGVRVRVSILHLLATSEAELQELVDRLDRVSRRYSLLIDIDKTKVMASDGIACHILVQNEQLVQINNVPIPWVSDYRRW